MSNRLARETSPYLLQHKNNPVDWYPWGEEALGRAVEENKPILLSIGYSACHWCHVMEQESFENPQIALLMNENFVSIKVDREERPDLDHIYQNVAQAITRGGGWPLTVFLTPDLKPYFGGTYFPPEDRYGRPGFPRVLSALADAYRTDPQGVAENARKLADFIGSVESVPSLPGVAPAAPELLGVARALLERVDFQEGGLSGAPKFPNPMLFSFLWRAGVSFHEARCKEAVLLTLTKMASGGIYDQLGGGFHRYSVDGAWSVPHFEKMLYDNGLLLKLYSEVVLSGDPAITPRQRELFTSVLLETCHYLEKEMTSPEGLFHCAQDADSEGEEGKFFVWDPEDLRVALSAQEARVFALKYGVTGAGNFEHGETVLHRALSLEEVAAQADLPEAEVRGLLASARVKLKAVRDRRIAPATDDKALASWNGLAISGLAWSSQALRHSGHAAEGERAAKAARAAFQAVREKLTTPEGRLWSSFQGGQGKNNGYLDDYAFLAMAALDLARISCDPKEIESCLQSCEGWIDVVLKHFGDAEGAGYFFTSDDHEILIQRPKTVFDQAIPSGVSVAIGCMIALEELDYRGLAARYGLEADRQLAALFPVAMKSPFGFGELLCAAHLRVQGPVVVSGPGAGEVFRNPQIFQKPQTAEQAGKILVCHRKACSPPLADVDALWRATAERL